MTISGNITPNVCVLYAINGSKKFKPVNTFSGIKNYDKDEGFQPSEIEFGEEDLVNNWYTAILKPHSDGESLRNIYSIQLMFIGKNQLETYGSFPVNKDFQINDITIIYRSKNAN